MNLKSGFFEKRSNGLRIAYDEQQASDQLAAVLVSMLPITNQPIVFICIGTDRSTGDSLGPLVGTLLEEKNSSLFHVYGTLEDPIHAVNLETKLEEIKLKHDNAFIIGIDACLGKLKSVGHIQLADGPVKPGAGVKKELPAVGHIHITGIVNISGFMEFFVLQNTRLNLVLKMAKTIADGIEHANRMYQRKTSLAQLKWRMDEKQTP